MTASPVGVSGLRSPWTVSTPNSSPNVIPTISRFMFRSSRYHGSFALLVATEANGVEPLSSQAARGQPAARLSKPNCLRRARSPPHPSSPLSVDGRALVTPNLDDPANVLARAVRIAAILDVRASRRRTDHLPG